MDNFALNATAIALNEKNIMIAQLQNRTMYLENLSKHQEGLLANAHAEKAGLTRKIENLRLHTAGHAAKLTEKDTIISKLLAENAALKEQVEEQNVALKAQKKLFDGKLMYKELSLSRLQGKYAALKKKQAKAPSLMPVMEVCQEDAETQTQTGYVLYAAEKTEEFAIKAMETNFAGRKEIRKVLSRLADWEEVLDDVMDLVYEIQACEKQMEELETALCLEACEQGEACFGTEPQLVEVEPTVSEASPQMVTPQKAKKVSKKKKAPKETPEEKAAREQAELKAHEEAVRARKEQERREEAKKTSDRKAKMQALRSKKEQEGRMQVKTAEPRAAIQPTPADLVRYTNSLPKMGSLHDFVGPYDA